MSVRETGREKGEAIEKFEDLLKANQNQLGKYPCYFKSCKFLTIFYFKAKPFITSEGQKRQIKDFIKSYQLNPWLKSGTFLVRGLQM